MLQHLGTFYQAVGCTYEHLLESSFIITICRPLLQMTMFDLKVQRMLQVEVAYQPPVTTSSQGAAVTEEAAIAIVSGPAHAPFLPAHAVTGRSCFNLGSAAQRTITPSALLTLVDR